MVNRIAKVVLALIIGVCFTNTNVFAASSKIKNGSSVELKYSLTADGRTIIPAANLETAIIQVGSNVFPPEFEKNLIGLRSGDKKTIELKPNQAYGMYRQSLLTRIAKSSLPPEFRDVQPGNLLTPKKGTRPIRVAQNLADSIVLDQNHPLAGKTLVYTVQIVDVK